MLALCVYLQEVAGHHADAPGVSMRRLQADDRAGVLSHLHLEIGRPPCGNETVTIETWPLGLEALRHTETNDLLAAARTRWTLHSLRGPGRLRYPLTRLRRTNQTFSFFSRRRREKYGNHSVP